MTDTPTVEVTPEHLRHGVIVIEEDGRMSLARPVAVVRSKDTDILVVTLREDD